jgi:hypothetical protein
MVLHFQGTTKVKVLLPRWFDNAVRPGIGTTEYDWPTSRILRVAQDLQDFDMKKSDWTSGEEVPVDERKTRGSGS